MEPVRVPALEGGGVFCVSAGTAGKPCGLPTPPPDDSARWANPNVAAPAGKPWNDSHPTIRQRTGRSRGGDDGKRTSLQPPCAHWTLVLHWEASGLISRASPEGLARPLVPWVSTSPHGPKPARRCGTHLSSPAAAPSEDGNDALVGRPEARRPNLVFHTVDRRKAGSPVSPVYERAEGRTLSRRAAVLRASPSAVPTMEPKLPVEPRSGPTRRFRVRPQRRSITILRQGHY